MALLTNYKLRWVSTLFFIEEIANNKQLTPEQRAQQLEALTQKKEEVIKAGMELQKVTKQMDYSPTAIDKMTD